ncbi:MAG: NCS2 family permease [Candidatus Nomurabacteria bacterium]|jgi:AGZA family xanthine/uracil permease-like MFS transporter|nr:NCS2 family permease [Candidatus Nomurabacteria bacterium]
MFEMEKYGTNTRTEIVAGITTFVTMAYIIIVNQSILSQTGIPAGAVILATCIAAAIGTGMMALANVPYAQAPGMGLNAFFTFTVCFGLGFTWQQALAMVFVCGIINFVITVTSIRKQIIAAIPKVLQYAVGAGIGIFIAYIGIKDAGLLQFTIDPGTYVALGDGNPATTTIVAGSGAVPGIMPINTLTLVMAVLSIVVMAILMANKVKGAILISIVAMTIVGAFLGMVSFDFGGYIGTLGDSFVQLGGVFGQSLVAIPSLFADPTKIVVVLATIFAFSLTDVFDTIGTFIGTGRSTGIFSDKEIDGIAETKGFKTRLDKALLADSLATSIGALFGTSNTTTYVESSAGIAAGGRTGATALTTTVCFLLSILFAPLVLAVPGWATAPALIIVGVLMAAPLKEIDWKNYVEAIPAFLAATTMALMYSISIGMAIGFLFYCILKLASGKMREIHPVLAVVTVLFLCNFVITAIV